MNRRAFFRTMVGGIAATTAIRTWPFRVFSFPSEVKVARALPMDLGFNVFDYAGLPMIESEFVPVGKIYTVRIPPRWGEAKAVHPQTLNELVSKMKVCRLEGITVP